ncbi:MAG: tyrosine-type recombinase/integrase [Rhizobiales bacterium]|nr:tyrosine-type recombinase/integrase [Hyphomicrobiales bacterium]
MARKRALSAREVDALMSKLGTHRVDENLFLQVREDGTKSWAFRYSRGGKMRVLGLGAVRRVPYAEARTLAGEYRTKLWRGVDISAEHRSKREVVNETLASSTAPTFSECAESYISEHEAGWKNPKHRYQWRATLEQYAGPVIGHLPVDQVTANHIVDILKPHWLMKTESMKRLRGRIEAILDWAKVSGYRSGENPARWKESISHRLPKPSSVTTVEHHPAVSVADAPVVFATLTERDSMASKLLRVIALTSLRFTEAAGGRWGEVNLDEATWQVPGSRMKMKKPHALPLARQTVDILRALRPADTKPDDLIFPGQVRGQPVTDSAVRTLLRKVAKPDNATTHGWRSTMRDWVAENGLDGDAAEAALAHKAGDDVTVAYLRSPIFERRKVLAQAWADYLTGVKPVAVES